MPSQAETNCAPLFKRFVEPGRLVNITYGPLRDQTAVIVDMVDLRRVVIDGENIQRQVIPLKWVQLTSVKCKVGRACTFKNLKKAMAAEKIMEQWAATKWCKKISTRQARLALTDMDRFKLRMAKKEVNKAVKKAVKPSKKK